MLTNVLIRRLLRKVDLAHANTRKCYACDPPSSSDRPRAVGRVFALTNTEATQSGSLILDFCLLLGNRVLVLFDSGALHSFISHECVKKLGLSTRDLGCKLIVSKPTSGQVSTNSTCVGCLMEVEGRRFKVNLICLPLEGLDVILGMDWL